MLGSTTVLLVVAGLVSLVSGHGRLIEPPSRSTMWRYGFSTPPNYNDHELYCGGFTRQWVNNGGKCGICGDAWDQTQPRPNEAGGKYSNGIIVRKYRSEAAIRVKVELTANHRGHFEFRVCPNNNFKRVARQSCLDKYLLEQADGSGPMVYPGEENKVYEVKLRLPHGLTCSQCVFQWKYIAGNNWGTCENGTGAVGCGPQEEFRACADVMIVDKDGASDDTEFNDISDEDNEIPDHDLRPPHDLDVDEDQHTSTRAYVPVIICLGTLMFAILLLGTFLCFFTKGRDYLKHLIRSASSGTDTHDVPRARTPIPPPRGHKKMPLSPPRSIQGKLDTSDISCPTAVCINGITVPPQRREFHYPPLPPSPM